MRGLVQRVSAASVLVEDEIVGTIGQGVLLLLGVQRGDSRNECEKLASRVANYRIFPDDEGRMNRSLADTGGGILVVSQFTLAADTRKGLRPSFSPAAEPQQAQALYDYFVECISKGVAIVQTGRFGADMKVSLCNDGPVTFLLEV
ncbi:MAG: D-tyrosyl-tRNA(Tyr) deacylase [Gammaproteobacteria bacterium BRH_c0]|nr:MAG: D-tyrosyl-tRNA(Tyr) deacylase [Gammaproteobacteria bacterium BRH_c0]